MPCPFKFETCERSCPLNEKNVSDSCKLRWLEKLPIIAREQEHLNENMIRLTKQLDELTYAILQLSKNNTESERSPIDFNNI